ncbi:hypothetical protein B5F25_05430 [Bacteroides sp. An19]|nr:hypothetical protein B5F25_05430 [Bacteroides sp. An19]
MIFYCDLCKIREESMDKDFITINQVKTKQDVKKFLQQFVDKKRACTDCVCEGRPVSELASRGIKVAKLSEVLS